MLKKMKVGMMIIDAITTTTEENVKGEDKNTFWDKNSA
jgi:hypothetical protein